MKTTVVATLGLLILTLGVWLNLGFAAACVTCGLGLLFGSFLKFMDGD